mgnify:CR=1 FL=1
MIISGLEIKNMLNKEIFIEPFDDSRLNPNSYNLRLHNELLVYDSHVLDMKVKNETKTISIPPEGLVLEPGIVYLGRTVEYTKTLNHVPMLEGRSSIGRLGIYIHVTAGFGDVGLLDSGNILYSTGTDISERRNMSNILSYDFRRLLQNV